MKEFEDIMYIKKYINQELTSEERIAFEKKCKENPAFAEEVAIAVALNAQHKVEKKLHWQTLLKAQKDKTSPPEVIIKTFKPRKRSIVYKIAAVFLIAVLITAIYFFLPKDSGMGALADQYLSDKYPSPVITMNEQQLEEDWKLAILAYQNEQYHLAIQPLEDRLLQEQDAEQLFYLGLCYLYQQHPNYDNAILNLEKSKALNTSRFGEKSDWFMALALLRKGEEEKAKQLLQTIIAAEGNRTSEALKLLEEMK